MTGRKRDHQKLIAVADQITGTKGCNHCYKQRPAHMVKPRKTSRGVVRWICQWCQDAMEAKRK